MASEDDKLVNKAPSLRHSLRRKEERSSEEEKVRKKER